MVSPALDGQVTVVMGELFLRFGADEAFLEGPGANPGERQIDPEPDAIREFTRSDGRGRYRPLSGARTLPRNWHARFATLDALTAAVDAIYPLAFEHIAAHDEGRLRVVPLEDVLARQSGRYASASETSERGRAIASAALCSRCARAPVWRGAGVEEGAIPCPEPCSVLVSLCREVAFWERDRPERREADPSCVYAAFEQPGNEIREHCLALLENSDG